MNLYKTLCLLLGTLLIMLSFNHNSLNKEYEECLSSYETLLEDYGTLYEDYNRLKNETKNISSDFTNDEVYMLARCVEAEAGVNNLESQKYVTQVILNRLNSKKYPNTLEEVIYQKSGKVPQFSVAYNGAMNREVKASTLFNVLSVLEHGTDMPKDVFYFYADYVTNNWVNTRETYKVVEGTVFAY